MAQDCNQRIFGTGLSASIHLPRTGLSAFETAINGGGTTLSATRRPHRSRPVLLSGATYAHLESALAVLLSRTPPGLVTGASHHTKNHPIETPQLSLPPCPMRVDLTKTVGREEPAGEAPARHLVSCR